MGCFSSRTPFPLPRPPGADATTQMPSLKETHPVAVHGLMAVNNAPGSVRLDTPHQGDIFAATSVASGKKDIFGFVHPSVVSSMHSAQSQKNGYPHAAAYPDRMQGDTAVKQPWARPSAEEDSFGHLRNVDMSFVTAGHQHDLDTSTRSLLHAKETQPAGAAPVNRYLSEQKSREASENLHPTIRKRTGTLKSSSTQALGGGIAKELGALEEETLAGEERYTEFREQPEEAEETREQNEVRSGPHEAQSHADDFRVVESEEGSGENSPALDKSYSENLNLMSSTYFKNLVEEVVAEHHSEFSN